MKIRLLSLVVICVTAAGRDDKSDTRMEEEDRLEIVEQEIEQLRSQLVAVRQRRQIQSPKEVGFTAVLSANLTSLGLNQAIVFDRLVSNIGSGYSTQTGSFTAPVLGPYQFYTTIISKNKNDNIETEIVRNGIPLVRLYSGGSSSNMVIVPLEKGDRVWVQVRGANNNPPSIHCCFSTFSGFRLHYDEDALG